MRAVLRVTAYSDAPLTCGAEINLGNALEGLADDVHVTVAGTTAAVVEALVARRPGAEGVAVAPRARARAGRARMLLAHVAALRRSRPDVVHVNLHTPWAGRHALVAAFLLRVPVVVVHHLALETRPPGLLRWLWVSSRRAAAVVVVGSASALAVERLARLPAGSVRVIHNGVTPPPAGPPPTAASGAVVGSLGRLEPRKGYDVLLDALARLPGVSAELVGSGSERARLEALAARLGVAPRLRLHKWSDQARGRLPGFDVFVLPSRQEGLPMSILEAMLAGLPVVATRVGSVADAVEHGVTGLLVEPDDPAALAGALRELLDDPARRAAMGARGREEALRRFTSARMVSRYEALYRETARGA